MPGSIKIVSQRNGEYIYTEHIVRITGPSRSVNEFDGTGKSGINVFLDSFNTLIDTYRFEEIPPIPIDYTNNIFDGSHRVAAAFINSQSMIKTCLIADKSNNQPSSFFFNSASNGHPPIDVNILDAASLESILLISPIWQ